MSTIAADEFRFMHASELVVADRYVDARCANSRAGASKQENGVAGGW
jgi:hypothetical protein